jgi:nitroreductase
MRNGMSIIETIKERISCRTYSDRPIEPDKTETLKTFLKANTISPFGSEIRFQLLDFDKMEMSAIKTPGTYGVIKGARQFMAGVIRNRPKAMEDFGYCMEKNILKATSLGLGTCWLGGTFNRGGFAEKMDLADGELLPAVSPIGYSSDRRSLVDRFFRFSAGSDKRKSWHELFFDGNIDNPLQKESAGPYETAFACLRIGPSASNMQPWRIIKYNNILHFYLKRTPGYNSVLGDIKLQNMDMGIAMCHFELSSVALGLQGNWQVNDPRIRAGEMEYIASWISEA